MCSGTPACGAKSGHRDQSLDTVVLACSMAESQQYVVVCNLQVERGIRYKEMGVTFDAQLADAKRQKSEASDREAKRLAFYIFWNVKRDFDRCWGSSPWPLCLGHKDCTRPCD
jgi:hypothetical protein